MSALLRVLESALISAVLIVLALSLLMAVLEPIVRGMARNAGAGSRVRIAVAMLCGPALCGIVYALVLLFAAQLVDGSQAAHGDCSAHHQSWLHACLWHPIERGNAPWLALMLAVLASAVMGLLIGVWRRRAAARRELEALLRLANPQREARLRVLSSETPIALACEIGEGQVLLSSALLERLPPEQLQVVIEHERAHLRHHDAQTSFFAGLASMPMWPGARKRLLDALRLAQEQRSDEDAARRVGSRLLVAETLLAVEQLHATRARLSATPLAHSFAHGFARERVLALLAPLRSDTPAAATAVLALQGLGALASTGWVHGLSELLITSLSGAAA